MGGAGLLNLFAAFLGLGEPAPTDAWDWCNILVRSDILQACQFGGYTKSGLLTTFIK